MNTQAIEQFEVINSEKLAAVEGGVGYKWRCSDGFTSAWHMFRNTAQTNANNYMLRNRGVFCTVDFA